MKKFILGLCISTALIGSVSAFAASGYNKTVSTGLVKFYSLNKSASNAAKGRTDFVPYSGNSNYKAYVYVKSENSSGTQLKATEAYGKGNGTASKPDKAECELTQNGTYRWLSTHRSNNINDYAYLTLSN